MVAFQNSCLAKLCCLTEVSLLRDHLGGFGGADARQLFAAWVLFLRLDADLGMVCSPHSTVDGRAS